MRIVPIALILALAAFMIAPWAAAQDEVIMMNSAALGAHERPLVRFTHDKHAEVIECQNCHHDFDQYFNNTGGDGVKCSECHSPGGGDNPVPLTTALHRNCQTCHIKMAEHGSATGPVMCGDCHVRGAVAPAPAKAKAKEAAKPEKK